jgi:hypothetical protein
MLMDMAPAVAAVGAFLGILFVYSGVTKALAYSKFAIDLLLLPYMPHTLARPAAIAIPALELVAGAFAMVGHLWAQITIIALLAAFSAVALVARARNQRIPCNCFGSQDREFLSTWTVVRNGGLCAIALVCIFAPRQSATMLSGIYGLILLLLFLAVTATARNRQRSRLLRGETA